MFGLSNFLHIVMMIASCVVGCGSIGAKKNHVGILQHAGLRWLGNLQYFLFFPWPFAASSMVFASQPSLKCLVFHFILIFILEF
jgi:hypothetical protein